MDYQLFNKADSLTRRRMVKMLAAKFLTLNYVSNLSANPTTPVAQQGGGKAKSVIIIKFGGGLSQVDTFDIKEGNKATNQPTFIAVRSPQILRAKIQLIKTESVPINILKD